MYPPTTVSLRTALMPLTPPSRTRTPAADANSSAHEPKSTTAGVSGGGLPNPLALLAASSSEGVV